MYILYGAFGLLLLSASVTAQPTSLTETKAVRLGLSRTAVQQRIEGNIARAESDVIAAETWTNPSLSYGREALDNDEDATEQSFVISQKFDFSGRRALYKQAADHNVKAAQSKSDAWQSDLTKNIRDLFYSALYEQERRRTYQTAEARIHLISSALQKRRNEGDVSIYDYQRVWTERAAIEAKARNASVDAQVAWQTLWGMLGSEESNYQTLDGELLPQNTASFEVLLVAAENQPTLRHLREQAEASRLQQRAENITLPDVTFGLGLKREETNEKSDNGLVIHASIPLPLFDKRLDKRTRYKAEAITASSEYELKREKAIADLKALHQQTTQYKKSAVIFRQDAVKGAREPIEIAEAYYRAGEVGILELLDAYRGELNTELAALELEFKARQARIKLDYLTGGSAL